MKMKRKRVKQSTKFKDDVTVIDTPKPDTKRLSVGQRINLSGFNKQKWQGVVRKDDIEYIKDIIKQFGQKYYISNAGDPQFNTTVKIKPFNDVSAVGTFRIPYKLAQKYIDQSRDYIVQKKIRTAVRSQIKRILKQQGQQQDLDLQPSKLTPQQQQKVRAKLFSQIKKYQQNTVKLSLLSQKLSQQMDDVKQYIDRLKIDDNVIKSIQKKMQQLASANQIVDDYVLQLKISAKASKAAVSYKDVLNILYSQVNKQTQMMIDELLQQQKIMKKMVKKYDLHVNKVDNSIQQDVTSLMTRISNIFKVLFSKLDKSIKRFNKFAHNLPPIVI